MAQVAMPSADLLPVSCKANIPYRLVRLVAVPLLQLLFRFDVEGLGNVPRTGTATTPTRLPALPSRR